MKYSDKRQTKRYSLPLKLTYFNPLTNARGESMTEDICTTGLRFPVNEKMPHGAVLNIKVEDPFSDKLVCLKAQVIWSSELIGGRDDKEISYKIGVKLLKKRLY